MTQPMAEGQPHLVGVNGNPLSLQGTISLGGKDINSYWWWDNITVGIILGMDFQAAEDCLVNVG